MSNQQVYRMMYQPFHPKADVTGMVSEHIVLTEQELGRSLTKNELVHHCDFDRLNNEPSNRLVMTRLQHQQLPAFQARFIIKCQLYEEFVTWWKEVRDEIDVVKVLKMQLVKAENDRCRLMSKMKAHENAC